VKERLLTSYPTVFRTAAKVRPIHCLVRFSERWAPSEGTLSAHINIFKTSGIVWVAKFGKPIGKGTADVLNTQIAEGTDTYLLLVDPSSINKDGGNMGVFRLSEITDTPPRTKSSYPDYYSKVSVPRGSWFASDACRLLPSNFTHDLTVASSLRSVSTALSKSMNGTFIVFDQQGLLAPTTQNMAGA